MSRTYPKQEQILAKVLGEVFREDLPRDGAVGCAPEIREEVDRQIKDLKFSSAGRARRFAEVLCAACMVYRLLPEAFPRSPEYHMTQKNQFRIARRFRVFAGEIRDGELADEADNLADKIEARELVDLIYCRWDRRESMKRLAVDLDSLFHSEGFLKRWQAIADLVIVTFKLENRPQKKENVSDVKWVQKMVDRGKKSIRGTGDVLDYPGGLLGYLKFFLIEEAGIVTPRKDLDPHRIKAHARIDRTEGAMQKNREPP